MKLSVGIVGLPNVGKSTLFHLITNNDVNIANYPFCTIDPNVGIVPVPDERVDNLAKLSESAKKIPAVVEFYDIAGLVRGANKGEGLGNQFLTHIRETQIIVQVLRCFSDESIIHVEESIDPLRDMEIINTELILKDLDILEKRIKKLEAEARSGDKDAKKNLEVGNQVREELLKGKLVIAFANEPLIKELQLLTAKKQIYLLNGKESHVPEALKSAITSLGGASIIADLGSDTDIGELVKAAYRELGLISFFTTGPEETRSWIIVDGSTAPQAAGAIHSDFEKKFIRADVVAWNVLLHAGGWTQAQRKGLIHTEGKEYRMKDGDVILIKHSA
mgnify:CR=1 FL=1